MAEPISRLARPMPDLPPIAGIRMAAGAAGLRYEGRTDVLLVELSPGSTAAGVFTRNKCPGAPVDLCRANVASGRARGLVVNAGNANVFTGRAGRAAAAETARVTARLLSCPNKNIYVASTGTIGQAFPTEMLCAALPELFGALQEDGFADAARAIMTTDTFPKAATRVCSVGGVPVRITGIAKGSGMIAPDMATMLCFVFTDAKLPAAMMQDMLRKSVMRSFNCTTVDSDTSTSDMVLFFATGATRHPRVTEDDDADVRAFRAAFDDLLMELALMVVRDGEGATKLVRVDVIGATTPRAAKRIAMSVANSPLVKTAIAGGDANWGRIAMAVGKAGETAERDRLSIGMGGHWIVRDGEPVAGYDEAPVAAHLAGDEVTIDIDLGLGRARATVWTCDLTHGYIDINGSYRS